MPFLQSTINSVLMLAFLVTLLYTAVNDVRRRKVDTKFFLAFDIVLFGYFAYFDWMLTFVMIPIVLEFVIKGKESYIPYGLILLPFLHQLMVSHVDLSLMLYGGTVIIIKVLFTIGRFGSGDIKILETAVMLLPTFFYLRLGHAPFATVQYVFPAGIMLLIFSLSFSAVAVHGIMRLAKHPLDGPESPLRRGQRDE